MATLDVDPSPPSTAEVVRERSGPTPLLQFAERLGLTTPQDRTARAGKIEAARAQLKESADKIAETETLVGGDIERGATDITTLSAERTKAAAEQRPVPPTLKPPPSTQSRAFLDPGPSVLGQIQTIMLGIGQIGMQMQGLKGGGYAIAATSAMKGMLEGWQAGDAERVKRQYTEWKANQDNLLTEHTLARETYQDVLKDFDRRMDDRMAEIELRARVAGHTVLAEQARAKNIQGVLTSLESDRSYDLALQQSDEMMKKYMAHQADVDRAFKETQKQHAIVNQRMQEAGNRAREALDFRKQQMGTVIKLQAEDGGLTNKMEQMDALMASVARLSAKGYIPKGGAAIDKAAATFAFQTGGIGDTEAAADIENIKRLGTALLVGSEIAAGLSPSVARLKVIGEAEAAGATAIPKSFWDTWSTRQRKALTDRQSTVRKTLNTLGQTPTGSNGRGVSVEWEDE